MAKTAKIKNFLAFPIFIFKQGGIEKWQKQ